MTDRKMGDSSHIDSIPLDVNIAALYFNGDYAVSQAVAAQRFPAGKYVTVWIDVFGNAPQHAQVLDVEKGAASTAAAPAWIRARRAAVHSSLPTIYCNRSTMPALIRTCAIGGLTPAEDYQLWIATLDGTEKIAGVALRSITGVVACQYQGGQKAAFDLSNVYDPKWHPMPV